MLVVSTYNRLDLFLNRLFVDLKKLLLVQGHLIFFLNWIRIAFDVIPNHDAGNIVHSNVLHYNQNMSQLPYDHNASIAKFIRKYD